jgi:arginine-tRNA-protein transferase
MARVLEVLVEEPRPCSYLDDRSATLEHHLLLDVSPEELDEKLVRGWRRFGPDYFRPRCEGCRACVPTRVPTDRYRPNKSQRRAAKACAELELRLGRPVFDEERLALYHRWHASREEARGWDAQALTERGYRLQFAFPHPAARELSFREPDTGKLVGVALCDETPHCWSAIYFFYDPAWSKRSIGTANVVYQIELARRRGLPHVYLGYRVDGCASLAYKANFRPQERLVEFVEPDQEPRWVEATYDPGEAPRAPGLKQSAS